IRLENNTGNRTLFIDVNITNIADEPKNIRPSDYRALNYEVPWYWIANGTQINCSYGHGDGDIGPTELLLPGESYSYSFDVRISNMFNGSMFIPLNSSFDSYNFYLASHVYDNPSYKPSNILSFTEDELLGVPSR
ncbi:MAG: hypothetical protein Q7J68_03200, partial [Thermoplasmata archaeon]|nr:hypothetical protein [Thermoplasmata archaeon]